MNFRKVVAILTRDNAWCVGAVWAVPSVRHCFAAAVHQPEQ